MLFSQSEVCNSSAMFLYSDDIMFRFSTTEKESKNTCYESKIPFKLLKVELLYIIIS